jgi:DNA-directed RNA polymerase specialized sigma24 family protein
METIRVNVSFDQIKQALRQLPPQEKMALWRLLDADLNRAAIARKFASTVGAIRKAYSNMSEEQVMLDAVKATREARRGKGKHGKSRS